MDLALRRVVLGFRGVAAVWLSVIVVVAAAERTISIALAVVMVSVAVGWTAVTLSLGRRSTSLRTWWWLAADIGVGVVTIVAPVVGGTGRVLGGGYPFSVIVLAAYTHGQAGAMAAAIGLVAGTTVRLAEVSFSNIVDVSLIYVIGGPVLAWAMGVLVRSDNQRQAAESALAEERARRIRTQERAETAAHLHDSVLQTLALIQRRGDDVDEVRTLARRQERELRAWLSGARGGSSGGETFAAAVKAAAAAVEADHRIAVEVVTVGDVSCDDHIVALVSATREALVNAAKHAGVGKVEVYAEVGPTTVMVFVRDRGAGFDPAAVSADRQGIRESISGRLARHGGQVTIRSAPGEGTEVEMEVSTQPSGECDEGADKGLHR